MKGLVNISNIRMKGLVSISQTPICDYIISFTETNSPPAQQGWGWGVSQLEGINPVLA